MGFSRLKKSCFQIEYGFQVRRKFVSCERSEVLRPKKLMGEFFWLNLKSREKIERWQAVCGESRTHGLERGKIPR